MEIHQKKKVLKIICIIFIIITVIITISLYIAQKDFRQWVDINIFKKSITEEDIISISLNTDQSNQVYVYSKYIAILNNQIITLYNRYGEKVTDIDVNINTGIFDATNKYFVIAENNGQEICLILDKTYLWSNKVEGEIQQVHVNRNGYVAVITKDSTYKSILTLYNSDGIEQFKRYFSETKVIDIDISNNNEYIAVGEIDSSGVLIQSNVKILSVDNAKNNPDETVIYTYNAENGRLLVDVNYQSKNQIACMYDDGIDIIQDNQNRNILKVIEKQITYMSANLNNYITYVEEKRSGVFKTDANIQIKNTQNDAISTFNLEEVTKELYVKDNTIALNVGTGIYFLNCNGNLIKKYTTHQEITNVLFSDNLAGIIYKDKVVVIAL